MDVNSGGKYYDSTGTLLDNMIVIVIFVFLYFSSAI